MAKITNRGTLKDGRGRVRVTTSRKRVKSVPARIDASYGKDGEVVLKHTPAPPAKRR